MWGWLGIGGLGIGGGAWWFGIQGEGCACQGRCNTGLSLRLLEDMSFEVWLKNMFRPGQESQPIYRVFG